MDLVLGPARFSLPDDDALTPTLLLALGKEEKQKAMAVGPTMAKAKQHVFRRSMSVTFSVLEPSLKTEEVLEVGINQVVQKMRAKVVAVKGQEIRGAPARVVEFTYDGPEGQPIRTLAFVLRAKDVLHTVMVSALNDKANDKGHRAQFQAILDSYQPA